MQAKRKLTALLLSLCMLLGMLPMTAFAAGAPAAPGDLEWEWTNSGLKVSWSQPKPIGELEIFEYEVSLFVDENLKEKETVRQATDYTFKTFGDLTGLTNFRVEVKAREAISGTGDRGDPASFDVTEWTEWSSASKETFVEDDSIKVNTEIIKHYTGVVDVALPGSDQKLYKEGIEAADDADIEAIMDLLYAYFEENKATVPELADVAKADLTTEMVLTRIESSRTVGSINTEGEGRPVVVVHEVVDKYYDLRLVYKEQHEHVWAEDWTSDGTHHWKACTAEGCAEKDQYGVHQIANGVCTVCKAEVETSTEPTDPTDPTTPTDPTEPTDPAKPEQQGKPSGQTESPQTGDSSDMALWLGLMLASCGGVLGMLFYRRKKAAAGK